MEGKVQMGDDKQREPETRRISRQDFRANPAQYILAAEKSGPIAVVDDLGTTRMLLSSPLAIDEPPAE
ncbi:MAG: hypothetical protein CMN30_29725 [Sandaracinus sp.]|nr:hypothetical protein [Sandaracinus sp.]|tara:strand:- start:1337 stop:1540 length:204 start_codon:yes stop_codon:yes gene_type:complete